MVFTAMVSGCSFTSLIMIVPVYVEFSNRNEG